MESKQIENEKKLNKHHKLIKIILIFILFLVIVILYSRFIATKGLVVKEYKITNENFTESFYGLKIVHLSDLHYLETTNKKDLEKIVEEINLLKPDIVFITGDLYSRELSKEQQNDLQKNLANINSNIGKYAIKGNHDNDENWNKIISNTGFIDLNNSYDLIYNNNYSSIFIAGINTEDDINESMKEINNYLNQNKETNKDNIIYKILLLHKPDTILNFDYSEYNLILSGHSHNGQVRLPFIGAIYTPDGAEEYFDEYYELGNTKLFISSGIGTSKLNLRLFNRPSFNFYRLSNK